MQDNQGRINVNINISGIEESERLAQTLPVLLKHIDNYSSTLERLESARRKAAEAEVESSNAETDSAIRKSDVTQKLSEIRLRVLNEEITSVSQLSSENANLYKSIIRYEEQGGKANDLRLRARQTYLRLRDSILKKKEAQEQEIEAERRLQEQRERALNAGTTFSSPRGDSAELAPGEFNRMQAEISAQAHQEALEREARAARDAQGELIELDESRRRASVAAMEGSQVLEELGESYHRARDEKYKTIQTNREMQESMEDIKGNAMLMGRTQMQTASVFLNAGYLMNYSPYGIRGMRSNIYQLTRDMMYLSMTAKRMSDATGQNVTAMTLLSKQILSVHGAFLVIGSVLPWIATQIQNMNKEKEAAIELAQRYADAMISSLQDMIDKNTELVQVSAFGTRGMFDEQYLTRQLNSQRELVNHLQEYVELMEGIEENEKKLSNWRRVEDKPDPTLIVSTVVASEVRQAERELERLTARAEEIYDGYSHIYREIGEAQVEDAKLRMDEIFAQLSIIAGRKMGLHQNETEFFEEELKRRHEINTRYNELQIQADEESGENRIKNAWMSEKKFLRNKIEALGTEIKENKEAYEEIVSNRDFAINQILNLEREQVISKESAISSVTAISSRYASNEVIIAQESAMARLQIAWDYLQKYVNLTKESTEEIKKVEREAADYTRQILQNNYNLAVGVDDKLYYHRLLHNNRIEEIQKEHSNFEKQINEDVKEGRMSRIEGDRLIAESYENTQNLISSTAEVYGREVLQKTRNYEEEKLKLRNDIALYEIQLSHSASDEIIYWKEFELSEKERIMNDELLSEQEKARKIFEIQRDTERQVTELKRREEEARYQTIQNYISGAMVLSQVGMQYGEKMARASFMVHKLSSASQAAINSYEAYTKALPNVPLAKSILGLGLLQVAAIMAQPFQHSGSGSSGGAASGSSTSYRGFDFINQENMYNNQNNNIQPMGKGDGMKEVPIKIIDGFGNIVSKGMMEIESEGGRRYWDGK